MGKIKDSVRSEIMDGARHVLMKGDRIRRIGRNRSQEERRLSLETVLERQKD